MQFCCIYTLKCAFQSAGRFIAVRLTTPILFWISLSKASTNTVHSTSDERRYFIASRIWYKPLCTCCAIVNICFGYWYIKHPRNNKDHRVAHENQRRGGFCYYHYTTFIATVKIPFSKKNTGSHYFLQYIINSVLRNSFFHHILTSFTTYLS